MLDRFQVEASTLAKLDHPNIVRAHDFNKDTISGTEVYYLVMEYVEGQDLQRMVTKDGVLGYRKAADFIRQAAAGLAYAHEAGFVHCDIKPANLLVDGKGILKILDLGLARFASEARKASNAGPSVQRNAGLHRPRANRGQPSSGRSCGHLQPGPHFLLPAGRAPAVHEAKPAGDLVGASQRPSPANLRVAFRRSLRVDGHF